MSNWRCGGLRGGAVLARSDSPPAPTSDGVSISFPQMQQLELAQIRQREANLTALAAIGPRKKRKMDSPVQGASAEVNKESSLCTVCVYTYTPIKI